MRSAVVESRMAADRNARLVYSTDGEKTVSPKKPRPRTPPLSRPSEKGRGVRLRLDRRASGRVVTLVTGLTLGPDPLAALVRELKAACGAGGTLKDGAVELQGDHRETVESVLALRGIPSKRAGG
jgi:translation initiation factor 1